LACLAYQKNLCVLPRCFYVVLDALNVLRTFPGVAGGGGAVARALARTDVAPSTTVGDVADLLDVDVDKRSGVGVLVAAHDLTGGPVGVRQAGEGGGREAAPPTPPTVSDPADAVQKMAETVWMFVDKLS